MQPVHDMHCWLMAHSGSTLLEVRHGVRGLHKRVTARKSTPFITIATLRSHHPERGRLSQEQDGMTTQE